MPTGLFWRPSIPSRQNSQMEPFTTVALIISLKLLMAFIWLIINLTEHYLISISVFLILSLLYTFGARVVTTYRYKDSFGIIFGLPDPNHFGSNLMVGSTPSKEKPITRL